MKTNDALKRGMRDVADAVKRVAHEASAGGEKGSHINVAHRTNIRVARNIGQPGGTADAFAIQDAPIIQDGARATAEGTDPGRPRNKK
jgi:hypothetical protein